MSTTLSEEQQIEAVRKLLNAGSADYTIDEALDSELIREALVHDYGVHGLTDRAIEVGMLRYYSDQMNA